LWQGDKNKMSTAKERYYVLKKQTDKYFEGCQDPIHDYVTELEQDLKDSKLRRKDLLASLQSANQQKEELEQLLKDAEERASMFEMAGVLQFKEKEKLEQEKAELQKEVERLRNLIRFSRE
jgi:chromosome segregation ATPase